MSSRIHFIIDVKLLHQHSFSSSAIFFETTNGGASFRSLLYRHVTYSVFLVRLSATISKVSNE